MLVRVGAWLLAILIFVAIGGWSYRTGSELARSEVTSLQDRLAEVTAHLNDLQQERLSLQAQLAQQRKATETLQQKYDNDVPSGVLAAMLTLARQKIASGVSGDRLRDALRATENIKPCAGRVVSKRFAIGTRHTPDEGVSFLDGLIQVNVSTPPASDSTAAKPITVTFTRAAGGPDIAASGLPVRQPIVLDNSELQFTVAASDLSGYVVAAVTTCSRQ